MIFKTFFDFSFLDIYFCPFSKTSSTFKKEVVIEKYSRNIHLIFVMINGLHNKNIIVTIIFFKYQNIYYIFELKENIQIEFNKILANISLNNKILRSNTYIMDDFNVSSLHESKNEWGARLLTILTPLIIEGFKSIFDESYKLCKDNREIDKYLMTFQNFITRIPKWNATIIETERKRIIEKSGCSYLEELVTCIHIIQLKLLTAMRVGQKQKKIDINIPKLDDFIHKTYINVARKLYKNVYLFELHSQPLQIQKHNRELELIVQECILNAVRESIPVETILRAYMDETVEEDVVEEIKEEILDVPVMNETQAIFEGNEGNVSLKFNDMDAIVSNNGEQQLVDAPKTIARLEEISTLRNMKRKMEEEEETEKLNILNEEVSLDNLDVHIINPLEVILEPNLLLDDIEVLA